APSSGPAKGGGRIGRSAGGGGVKGGASAGGWARAVLTDANAAQRATVNRLRMILAPSTSAGRSRGSVAGSVGIIGGKRDRTFLLCGKGRLLGRKGPKGRRPRLPRG